MVVAKLAFEFLLVAFTVGNQLIKLVILFPCNNIDPFKTIFGTIYNCKFILSDRQKCHLQSSKSNAYRRFHPALITFLGLTNLILIYIGSLYIVYIIQIFIRFGALKFLNPRIFRIFYCHRGFQVGSNDNFKMGLLVLLYA